MSQEYYFELLQKSLKINRVFKKDESEGNDVKFTEENSILIKVEDKVSDCNTSASGGKFFSGTMYYSFRTFSDSEFVEKLKMKGWIFENLSVEYDNYRRTVIKFNVTDPYGKIEEFTLQGRNRTTEDFDKALFKFVVMKNFQNLEKYEAYNNEIEIFNMYSLMDADTDEIKNQLKSIISEYKFYRISNLLGKKVNEPCLKYIFVGNPGTGKLKAVKILNNFFKKINILLDQDEVISLKHDLFQKELLKEKEKKSILLRKKDIDLIKQNKLLTDVLNMFMNNFNIVFLLLTKEELFNIRLEEPQFIKNFGRILYFEDFDDDKLSYIVYNLLIKNKNFYGSFSKDKLLEFKQIIHEKNSGYDLKNYDLAMEIYYRFIDEEYYNLKDMTYINKIMS